MDELSRRVHRELRQLCALRLLIVIMHVFFRIVITNSNVVNTVLT
jgi:hypothetical protein